MRIKLHSIFVDDQQKALRFYTEVLSFVKKHDVPAGGARWITVVAPGDRPDLEIVLEPNGHPAARAFQEALLAAGIPHSALESSDIEGDVARLKAQKVAFTQDVTAMGPVKIAVFADTWGNSIQIYQRKAG
jgi:catechol 2,3-dioxygenase-like lactoylglutathione lyase family enzyme